MEHKLHFADIAIEDAARVSSEDFVDRKALPKVVSLFSGAGGLDLGFKYNGFKIPIALDISEAAIQSHKRNFPKTHSEVADLVKIGPKGVLERVAKVIPSGESIGLIGGPPCQGFSRANVGSKTDDPRNKIPQLYLEIVKCLESRYEIDFIVFENVLGIRDKKHSETYQAIIDGLKTMGFDVSEKRLCALDFGVPQKRNRIILSAMKAGKGYSAVKPRKRKGQLSVRSAIADLPEPTYFKRNLDKSTFPAHENHWTMQPKSEKFRNPELMAKKGRSFRRLSWDKPSTTIAFGNREIHVHPEGHRRLSIYEAMLLQGFPKKFVLEGNLSQQVEQVSNAVPPPLARSIARAISRALVGK